MNIYRLPTKFTKWGQVFTKVKEGLYTLIYARSDQNGIIAYEVFKRRSTRLREGSLGTQKGGKYEGYDQKELYPGNEDFGKWAKCCMDLEKAEEYFVTWENEKAES